MGRQAALVLVAQQLVQEIERLGTDQMLIFTVDEALPSLPRMPDTQHTLTIDQSVRSL